MRREFAMLSDIPNLLLRAPKEALRDSDCTIAQSSELGPSQRGALAAALASRCRTPAEEELLEELKTGAKAIAACVQIVTNGTDSTSQPELNPSLIDVMRLTASREPLTHKSTAEFVEDIAARKVADEAIGFWLMTAKVRGLPPSSTSVLTKAMVQSGRVYDYRDHPKLAGRRLVRRYPTGALSEKVALILPGLISSFANEIPVASPFLVAKSLGFTGGTWDKLAIVPGFKFPLQGEETVEVLSRCHVAMSVTLGDFNPADRVLYKMRSATSTIDSHGLAVSSIASKQLAVPAHRLLMDVRYGGGAFFAKADEAQQLAAAICDVVSGGGVPCLYHLTDTMEPNGTSVGNALEVAEAIAVMGGPADEWDPRGLLEQRRIVIDFFSKLMASEFSQSSASEWARQAERKFSNREVLRIFGKILEAHSVTSATTARLLTNPLEAMGVAPAAVIICSNNDGYMEEFDQKQIGHIVNFELGCGATEFAGKQQPAAGLILQVRRGDPVRRGQPLCRIVGFNEVDEKIQTRLRSSFKIRPT